MYRIPEMTVPTPSNPSPASECRLPLLPLLTVRSFGLLTGTVCVLVLVGIFELIASYTFVELEIAYVAFCSLLGSRQA